MSLPTEPTHEPTPGSHEPIAAPASTRGAVDLSALSGQPGGAPAGSGAPSAGATWVKRIGQAEFEQALQWSTTAPVVVSLGAASAPESVQLDEAMGALIDGYGGRLALLLVDAQKEQAVAQAFRVQQIPAVVAVVRGQPVPLFQGAASPEQMKSLFDELLQLAVQHGVTGTLAPFAAADPQAEPELPPLHQKALEALDAGDYAAAESAYREALAQKPNDHDAEIGLANVQLLGRVQSMDAQVVRTAGADRPDDLEAQLDVADLDLAGGHVEDAFRRLIGFVARSSGDERETARTRLVELFDVVGAQDDRVRAARQRLARVLF
ncbi:tetratricopeptide repeat protein [Zhihengliuella sp.]|uniref:tetratricopeptide repeat protein n=1 Tax=Zhihengliuella sp. TaxID=1954483 RepID=UPI002811548B|nr:tetratricopeptide repeat protein [Zhihengliuella sp.]